MKLPGYFTGEVLRHVTEKPATLAYPFEPRPMPAGFRGKLTFIAEKCVGCKLCQKDCPANAIFINKVGDKRFECVFKFDHCIYCAQCVDSCNKDAIIATPEFEMATFSRPALTVTYHAPPPPPPAANAAPAAAAPANGAPPAKPA